jgi:hypothetical protein
LSIEEIISTLSDTVPIVNTSEEEDAMSDRGAILTKSYTARNMNTLRLSELSFGENDLSIE